MISKMISKLFLALFLVVGSSRTLTFVGAQANFETSENYTAEPIASVASARGVIVDPAGDIIVATQRSQIRALYVENGETKNVQLLNNAGLGLNHGVAYNSGFLYASSMTNVYRWPYTPGQRSGLQGQETVIKGIPTGGHWTRPLVFDKDGLLYMSIGSGSNIDRDSSRARIRRFDISSIPNGGIEFSSGTVFADGLRNEVGLAFDLDGVLWGVQNSADNLNRADLGGDIHNTNPAEELTKYDKPVGTHYGYPYCWTVDQLQGREKGEQLAWPDFMNDGTHSDAWCKNINNNHPPTLALPAHYAPLGITFYNGSSCNSGAGAFPCSMRGDAFVAFHGSWNRDPPAGYRVVRIPIDQQSKLPTGEILDVMWEPDTRNCGRCFRPVTLTFDSNGHLIVAADASSEVFRIKHRN